TAGLSEWVAGQVKEYARLMPRYQRLAEVLELALRHAADQVAPSAIVQVRAKSVSSFAEKCVRKRTARLEPVRDFTDLCGGRVIAATRSQVAALGRLIVERFEVDLDNSVDASDRLGSGEFGYRSVHYVVGLRPGADYKVPVAEEIIGLRAEVQVRT